MNKKVSLKYDSVNAVLFIKNETSSEEVRKWQK